MADDFAAKNARRREHRARDPKGYRAARRAKKRLARGGAFGEYDRDTFEWQMCAYGRATEVGG